MNDAFDYKNLKEERLNAITHAIGFVLSIPALVYLILAGVHRGSAIAIVSFTIFGVSMLLLFLMSTLLHSMPIKVKEIFAILDHSSIYVLIAGTYTPFMLVTLRGALGWTLFGIIWGLTLLGILFKIFFINRFEKASLALYIIMGWLIIIAIKPLYEQLPAAGFWLLVTGGIFYTFGSVFFAWRRLPYNHAIWHLFVIAGSACMYFSVLLYV
ncbi:MULTISPECIES: hemolysin III family protein [unclassified Sporosarcina]|uniref:PAQR family membrane homeostasis protein TrhA n=1 Tax=unclassified Sporosarcina TaxID=2647733 RepID=UPI0020405C2B|nr:MULTISPECIES: hemolysin III family protein [unclassified Sporosarcina]GKV65781.1 hemolysin III [Sporosarcina sp. NCCP-2331]GLB55905.1 hemolysin III [Sporosarcina sp. NCCP-2378]